MTRIEINSGSKTAYIYDNRKLKWKVKGNSGWNGDVVRCKILDNHLLQKTNSYIIVERTSFLKRVSFSVYAINIFYNHFSVRLWHAPIDLDHARVTSNSYLSILRRSLLNKTIVLLYWRSLDYILLNGKSEIQSARNSRWELLGTLVSYLWKTYRKFIRIFPCVHWFFLSN